ncbi:hypothetical protein C0995_001878, partial [Termitomyces sp. Mi166
MALDQSSSPPTSNVPFHFPPHSNSTLTTFTFLKQLHSSSASATHATLINSGTTGTFVSLELALSSEEIGEPIELQLFDGTSTASELVTHHHSNVISLANGFIFSVDLLVTQLHHAMLIILGLPWLHDANSDIDWKLMIMMFKAGDAQLAASFSLKSRSTLTIKEVVDEDCSEPPNPEFIYQPILVDLEKKKS